jgi:glycosyltransferase involved in cell wall biosynthesis
LRLLNLNSQGDELFGGLRFALETKVTIGVCVKDSALTIGRVIDSLVSQDFPHGLAEVIFVDDGSKDDTLSFIESRVPTIDMQVKVIHHRWRGLGASRNRVAEEAKGDYIIWVDGDMILEKDFVRKQIEFMEMNPRIGIAKGILGILPKEGLVAFLDNVAYIASFYRYRGFVKSRALGAGGCTYRAEAIRQVGGFDVGIKGAGEDNDVEAKIMKADWLLYIGSPGVFYEQRRSSLRSLWRESIWHGYGAQKLFRGSWEILGMTPIFALFLGTRYAIIAYKMVHRRAVFLLPLQHAFKRIGWWIGFIKGAIDKDYRINIT